MGYMQLMLRYITFSGSLESYCIGKHVKDQDDIITTDIFPFLISRFPTLLLTAWKEVRKKVSYKETQDSSRKGGKS